MTIAGIVSLIGGSFGVAGAVLGLRAATVHVRNNLDEFIGDIHRQSRWASWSAVACIASVIGVVAGLIGS